MIWNLNPNRILGLSYEPDCIEFSNMNGLKPKPKPEQPGLKPDLPTLPKGLEEIKFND